MIVKEDFTICRNPEFTDTDWTGEAKYIISDDSELAVKIEDYINNGIFFKFIEVNGGVDIVETDLPEMSIDSKIDCLKLRLMEIDNKTTRPLRAVVSGEGTEEDNKRLGELEKEAKSLRDELNYLESGEIDETYDI